MGSALEIIGGPGAEGTVGILSAQPESQLHADWCNAMLKEVEDNPEDFANVTVLPIAYGDDLPDKSTTEAQAMLQNYPDIDVIISPTTVGILSAAKVIQDLGSECKVTGVGLPSEMAPYIESGICYDCYLWNPYDQGYLAAASVNSISTGESAKIFFIIRFLLFLLQADVCLVWIPLHPPTLVSYWELHKPRSKEYR